MKNRVLKVETVATVNNQQEHKHEYLTGWSHHIFWTLPPSTTELSAGWQAVCNPNTLPQTRASLSLNYLCIYLSLWRFINICLFSSAECFILFYFLLGVVMSYIVLWNPIMEPWDEHFIHHHLHGPKHVPEAQNPYQESLYRSQARKPFSQKSFWKKQSPPGGHQIDCWFKALLC